jgi:hypothetical protein
VWCFQTLVSMHRTVLFYQFYFVKTLHVRRFVFFLILFLLFMDFLLFLIFIYFSLFLSLTSTIIHYIHIFLLHGNFLGVRRSIVPNIFSRLPLIIPLISTPPKSFNCIDPPSMRVFTSYGPNQCILNFPGC